MPGENPRDAWLDRTPLPAGVIEDRRFTYVNAALLTLLGYEREAMIGMDFFHPVAPEDRARVRDRHMRRLRGEPVTDSYEFDAVRADGTRRRVEIWVSMIGTVTIFQLYDRTDRAAHQEKLLALAQLGATVQGEQSRDTVLTKVDDGAEALGFVLLRLEPDGDLLRIASRRAPAALRGPFDKALGRPIVGMTSPWSPGSRAAWSDGIAYIDDVPVAASQYWGPIGVAARDIAREQHFVRAVFLRIDEGGAPSHLLMLSADWLEPEDVPALSLFGAQITAALTAGRIIADLSARNHELTALNRIAAAAGSNADLADLFTRGTEAIEQVMHCAAIAIYLLRPDENVAVLVHSRGGSDEARQLYARVPLAGTRIGDVAREGVPRVLYASDYADPRRQRVIADMQQEVIASVPLIARSEVVGVMNVAYANRKRVEPREIEILQAAAAHFAAAVEANHLIDDLRRSYADLARAQERLVQRERLAALGELAAAVAHEVRNPLGVIFNSLGSLRRLVAADGDARVLFDILAEEAQRLNDIVGDLLDFARPVKLNLQPTNLASVVDEAIDAATVESDARIKIERSHGTLPPVRLDARLIRQAVLNVAMNATQSIDAEGTIRIRVHSVERDGASFAQIEIADDGPGIPIDVLPRIFEPFFTTRAKGTGIGLAVVKRIVEEHHGRLGVTSELGRGTTFVIELPLERERPDADAERDGA